MLVEKKILTIPQAAELCAVERMTMWRWVKAGYIDAFVTPGGHYRIRREDLESFLEDKGVKTISKENFSKAKILIVDDEESVCKVLKKIFSRHKYETDTAFNGFEAGIKLLKFKPDILILDLMMPEIDGFEICKLIKSNTRMSHIKILAFTGFDTPENREKVFEA
ncbi:response regulator, partial [Candidatus Latescibacterota bacterium]